MKDCELEEEIRTTPKNQPTSLSTCLNQVKIDDFSDSFFYALDGVGVDSESSETSFNPLVNIARLSTGIEITVDLPGIDPSDVELTLSDDLLTVRGQKYLRDTDPGENYYRKECRYGMFYRAVPIPADIVNSDACSAVMTNSVLFITLPWQQETRSLARKVPIKIVR